MIIIWISYAVSTGILILSLAQGTFAIAYTFTLLRSRRAKIDAELPKAAVVLSLRGSDPFLYNNMLAILEQDYPDFKLFIILDSELDSAWSDVNRIQSYAPDRVATFLIQKLLSTCSLKCCALAEVIDQLDEIYKVVVFLDGDTSPHRGWLRDLVEPLTDKKVGVSTGNRWYTPDRISWGALVRYFWNAGAVVQVWLNGITWGGSMAMRVEVIRQVGLVDAFRQSLVDDGTVSRLMRTHRFKTVFVPTVIMPNREDISVASFIPWSERQLMAAKSAESGWAIVLFHAFAIGTCVIAPLIILAIGTLQGNPVLIGLAFVSVVIYWSVAVLSTLAIETGMQRVLDNNQMKAKWINKEAIICFFPAIVLSHFVYFKALAGACIRTRVSWRGIEYQVNGINDVRRLNYQPYQSSIENHDTSSII